MIAFFIIRTEWTTGVLDKLVILRNASRIESFCGLEVEGPFILETRTPVYEAEVRLDLGWIFTFSPAAEDSGKP